MNLPSYSPNGAYARATVRAAELFMVFFNIITYILFKVKWAASPQLSTRVSGILCGIWRRRQLAQKFWHMGLGRSFGRCDPRRPDDLNYPQSVKGMPFVKVYNFGILDLCNMPIDFIKKIWYNRRLRELGPARSQTARAPVKAFTLHLKPYKKRCKACDFTAFLCIFILFSADAGSE